MENEIFLLYTFGARGKIEIYSLATPPFKEPRNKVMKTHFRSGEMLSTVLLSFDMPRPDRERRPTYETAFFSATGELTEMLRYDNKQAAQRGHRALRLKMAATLGYGRRA